VDFFFKKIKIKVKIIIIYIMNDQISFLYFVTYLVGFNNCVDCAVRERTLTCSPFGAEKKNAFMTKLSVMPFLAKNKPDHKDFFLSTLPLY
jgi:hypothetical protein